MDNHEFFDCRLQLSAETEKAVGVRMSDDADIVWLPKSQIVEFNRWNHSGRTFVRLRLPLWMAKSKGFDLSTDVMGRYDE